MKNITLSLTLFFVSAISFAGNFTYNRLSRIYTSDPWRCVEISKRYMKRAPEKPSPFYFASAVYKEKQKSHGQVKTRYMMMSKALRFAAKFEELNDLDMMSRVNWGNFVLELRTDTDALMLDLDSHDLSRLGDKLDEKCDHLMLMHNKIIIEKDDPQFPVPTIPVATTETQEETSVNEINSGYFGLATGNEIAPTVNKIQEQELMKLINIERESLFMKPLKWDESLSRAARYHANDMTGQNYTMNDSYDRVDGQLVFVAKADERIAQFQSKKNNYQQSIASGTGNARNTYLELIGKDASYDKLFNEENRAIGIGISQDPNDPEGYYWVIVLAEKR